MAIDDRRVPDWSSSTAQLPGTLGRMELALALVADGIVWTGEDGRVQWCNQSFDDLIGRRHIEILGAKLIDLLTLERQGQPVPPDAHPLTRVRDAEPCPTECYEMRRPDAQLIVEISAKRAAITPGDCGIVMVIRDITARTRSERELLELNAQVQAANRELEAFSYSVSHDLRAPLRSVDGFSQILLETYADHLGAQGCGYLHRVRAAAQHMGQLIDDLLMLARVTQMDLRRHTIDLSHLARDITTELQRAEPTRLVEIVVEPTPEAHGDARLLRLALESLLANAWKFTGNRDQARIEFGATETAGTVAFYVRDNGAGFDPAYADKLFRPFQRLHSVSDFPGTGVGLATVHRVVSRHGGRVWATGAVNQGATFSFTLS